MPTIITKPISDITLRVVPVASKASKTPASPGGIVSKIIKGSCHDANCATRIK
jgi:hypothetical protein